MQRQRSLLCSCTSCKGMSGGAGAQTPLCDLLIRCYIFAKKGKRRKSVYTPPQIHSSANSCFHHSLLTKAPPPVHIAAFPMQTAQKKKSARFRNATPITHALPLNVNGTPSTGSGRTFVTCFCRHRKARYKNKCQAQLQKKKKYRSFFEGVFSRCINVKKTPKKKKTQAGARVPTTL